MLAAVSLGNQPMVACLENLTPLEQMSSMEAPTGVLVRVIQCLQLPAQLALRLHKRLRHRRHRERRRRALALSGNDGVFSTARAPAVARLKVRRALSPASSSSAFVGEVTGLTGRPAGLAAAAAAGGGARLAARSAMCVRIASSSPSNRRSVRKRSFFVST